MTAAVSGIILNLIPESKLKSAYKILCCIVIFYSLFSIFNIRNVNFDFTDFDKIQISEQLSEKENEILNEEGEIIIDKKAEEILKANGIKAKCRSEVKYENGKFIAEKITVYGNFSETDKEAVKSMLKEILSDKTRFVFRETEENEQY